MAHRLVLLFIFLLQIQQSLCEYPVFKEDPLHAHEQLPKVVKATGYDLLVEPFFPYPSLPKEQLQDLTFRASISIHFQITQTTPYVWLNFENLNIQKIALKHDDRNEIINQFNYNIDKSQVKIQALEFFEAGDNHTLDIDYDGRLSSTADGGFFYFTYKFNETSTKTVVSTVFEPAMARRMFPCFDDVAMKATWNLKLIYPKGASIFSTTMEQTVEDYNAYKYIATFKQTPPVSSYLFSLAVGDFSYSSSKTRSGKDIRSIVFSELKDYSQESADISAKCVDSFENLVGYPYPLDKLDNIDTHDFFHGGGIENWGLILFTDVLPQLWSSLSATDKLEVKSIICHETAHQWTGDLVTTKHWGNEFLHESFANYFSYRMIQNFTTDNDYLESDFITERYYGFYGALSERHPIATNESNFDGVTYDTGCSVLRMIEGLTGQNDFYQIVKTYLDKFAYSNANMDDLLTIIDGHFNDPTFCGDVSIGELLRDYLTQLYFPVLQIDLDSNGKITFKQKEYVPKQNSTWNIPLFIRDSNSNKQQIVVLLKDGSICGQSNDWAPGTIFNYKSYSFAVIQYSAAYWEYLLKLDYSKIDEHTIYGLLMDLSMDKDLKKHTVGESILSRFIKKLVKDLNGNLSPHVLSFSLRVADAQLSTIIRDAAYPHLNWDAKTLRKGAFAEHLLLGAVKSNTNDVLNKATDYFKQFKTDCATLDDIEKCNKLNPNIRTAVYCAGAMNSDSSYNKFLNDYTAKLNKLYEPRFYLGPELNRAINGGKCKTHTSFRRRYLEKKGRNVNIDLLN